jgi:competence protein ComEA
MDKKDVFLPCFILLGAVLILSFAAYTFLNGPKARGETVLEISFTGEEEKEGDGFSKTPIWEEATDYTNTSQRQDEPINLNTATAVQLCRLPGVGEQTARRIIDYREANGRFFSTEELILIEGISREQYESLLEYITIE